MVTIEIFISHIFFKTKTIKMKKTIFAFGVALCFLTTSCNNSNDGEKTKSDSTTTVIDSTTKSGDNTNSVSDSTNTMVENTAHYSPSSNLAVSPSKITYLHWSGQEWSAEVVKDFRQGESIPIIVFKHTRGGQSHYDDYMDYKSDANESWRARIKYKIDPKTNTVSFYFTHCKNGSGACHDAPILNMAVNTGAAWQLSLESCTMEQFKLNTDYIKVNTKLLHGPPGAGGNTGGETGQQCNGNGIVTFNYTYPQTLYFYYWFAEDVANGSNECQIRKQWNEFHRGTNQFTIPKKKTLVYRIYTSTTCLNNNIRQYGSVYSCQVNNGLIDIN